MFNIETYFLSFITLVVLESHLLPTLLDLFFQLHYICQEFTVVNSITLGTEVRGLLLLRYVLIDKSECVPGLRRSAYSHHQMTSYLNIPFLKDLQERGLGRNY